MTCFCNETAEMATNQPFCSCPPQSRNKNVIKSHAFSKWKKKNNPMKKKSIPKGEERCSNCQVERDERKRNPTLLWLQTNTTSAAEWLDRLRLRPYLEHTAWMRELQTRQETLWRHACGQMWIETNVGRFTVTDWLIFHTCMSQNKQSSQPLSVVEVNDGEYK